MKSFFGIVCALGGFGLMLYNLYWPSPMVSPLEGYLMARGFSDLGAVLTEFGVMAGLFTAAVYLLRRS
jgi:hypothetical protein